MTTSVRFGRIPLFLGLVVGATMLMRDGATMQTRDAGDGITEASIRGHMEFLASDAMRGRGSGTEDEWRAAVYIGSQMRRWGIEPLGDAGGYVKKIESGRNTVAAPPTLTVGGITLTHGREMIVQSIGSGSATAPLMLFKPGQAIPQGAFVIVPEGVTPDATALTAAAGVIVAETPAVRATWATLATVMPGAGGRGRGAAPQARLMIAADTMAQVAAATGSAKFDVTMKPGYTWNAIGQLKGSDATLSKEVILLTAHLDHLGVRPAPANAPPSTTPVDNIFNGADDDASGSTAVLELAEALSKSARPKRTVMFAWFGSEESGGAGARDFLANPPMPLDQIVANLEFEMIANRDEKVPPHTLWLTGHERSNLGPELAKQGAKIVADPHPTENFFGRSDNIQLACKGIIAQTVSSYDALGKTYHKANDEVGAVDFAHMTDSIHSMYAPVLWLANSTFKPEWLPGKKPAPGNGCR